MSASLARRIRRIGTLPTLSLAEVMDDNQRTKLSNLHAQVDAAQERILSAKQQIARLKASPTASEVEKTAAKNALQDAESSHHSHLVNLQDLIKELETQLDGARRRKLNLSDEERSAIAKQIFTDAIARRSKMRETLAADKKARAARLSGLGKKKKAA